MGRVTGQSVCIVYSQLYGRANTLGHYSEQVKSHSLQSGGIPISDGTPLSHGQSQRAFHPLTANHRGHSTLSQPIIEGTPPSHS